jgi:4,5-dihydroxyphthalate decarboxylase
MVVVSRTLCEKNPDAVREVHRLIAQSADGVAAAPRFSSDEMRRSLELIISYTAQQGLIPRAYAVDELFDDVTRALF